MAVIVELNRKENIWLANMNIMYNSSIITISENSSLMLCMIFYTKSNKLKSVETNKISGKGILFIMLLFVCKMVLKIKTSNVLNLHSNLFHQVWDRTIEQSQLLWPF